MLLTRLGNKEKIVKTTNILDYFPAHDMFIDMFFGAGGLFFCKPRAKYNICNDKDSEVFNLFNVISRQKKELEKAFYSMPISDELFQYWRKNQETDPIMKALRFLFLSNFGFKGKSQTLRSGFNNTKSILYENIDKTSKMIFDVQFLNTDFRTLLDKIEFKHEINDKARTFIYADPPYLDTNNNYAKDCHFKQKDTEDLFAVLAGSGIKFALSEFDHPLILQLAKEYKLNITFIINRQNIGNRRNELLITNYQVKNLFNQHLF